MKFEKQKTIDLLIKIFIFFSLIIFLYTIYRMSIYAANGIELTIILKKYVKYLIISCALISIFFIVSKLNYNLKTNIVLSFLSILITIYILEIFLFLKYPNMDNKIIDKNNKSNELIKIKKFIDEDIYPFELVQKKFNIGTKKIYPISHISNTKIFLCNEVDTDIFYISDKYGFRNSNKDWNNQVIDYALIGDSFIHGACEKDENIISNLLKKKNKNVINLGSGGAGPLKELAIFTEYLPKLRPKNIIWFYSEGTDLTKDLRGEKKNKNLTNYLDDNYTQNLTEYQSEISSHTKKYIKKKLSTKLKQENKKKNGVNEKINVFLEKTKILRLWNLRSLISSFTNSGTIIDPLFFDIIEKVKKRAGEWNAKIYFVYMPEAKRYDNQLNRYLIKDKYRNKNMILKKLDQMNVITIDVDKDIFDKNENPLSYFNKKRVHYNKIGYELIANYLIERIQ